MNMACVVLPSETARLVYGYLIKENLDEIALQFLKSSPFLKDCYQIITNGYQFNTKLMGKELQDLLQEYSVIHNLVETKVNLLSKTSLLYKRIKLKCESDSEILDLILFWKHKHLKTEVNSSKNEKVEKYLNSIGLNCSNSDLKDNFDNSNYKSCKVSKNSHDSSEPSEIQFISNINNNAEPVQDKSVNEAFQTNKYYAHNENYSRQETHKMDSKNCGKTSECIPMEISGLSDSNEKNDQKTICGSVQNSENYNIPTSLNSTNSMPSLCLSVEVHSQDQSVSNRTSTGRQLEINKDPNRFDNEIKLINVEKEHQNENPIVSTNYPKSGSEQNGGTINYDSSSVMYIGSEVGNVTIGEDRNQIIVIPIDYYKSHENLQQPIAISTPKNENFNARGMNNQRQGELTYPGVQTVGQNTIQNAFNDAMNKTISVDENIITEADFLTNNQLMLSIEKDVTQSLNTMQPVKSMKVDQSQNSAPPLATPLIVLSQTVLPARTSRYRPIYPKKEEPNTPAVVVVQPLLERKQDLITVNSRKSEPKASEKNNKKKTNNKVLLPQKQKQSKIQKSENHSMPLLKSAEKTSNGNQASLDVSLDKTLVEGVNEIVPNTIINEEKENVDKGEKTKKTETPVYMTRRNSKRLSLSTPRRRNHIRALEFETPPKTKDDKQKSKTSPRVKVEQVTLKRRSVRNTLFKSPIPETSFKLPAVAEKKVSPIQSNSKIVDSSAASNNELSLPIVTQSPNTKLSDAWENLTGVECVLGEPSSLKENQKTKKAWDADLRCFAAENVSEKSSGEKKRTRRPEKIEKNNRKTVRKKPALAKKSKPPTLVSPSKMSLTAKRNTYSINGNEEGSPPRSLLDDLKIVTPFKGIVDSIRPTEETPFTKLLRENINNIDVDLSMINTPTFPPTPSILVTPDVDEGSLLTTNYYCPSKDSNKEKATKITDYFQTNLEKVNKKETKEMHDKVIDDLVCKAKEIIGIGKENQEDNSQKARPSGKILSMVKIQMLSQCDKKLCENIPINEDKSVPSFTDQNNTTEDGSKDVIKSDLREELEKKKKRALSKIKVVKENLGQNKNKVAKRWSRRKTGSFSVRSNKSKSEGSDESVGGKRNSESDDSLRKAVIYHSTPYPKGEKVQPEKENSEKKIDGREVDEIRQEFPPFNDDKNKYPEVSEKTKKKLHYVEHFLKLEEIVKYLGAYDDKNPPKLCLKPSLRKFFAVFHKWLKHPHKHEMNASKETKAVLQDYLAAFEKVNTGLNVKNKRLRRDSSNQGSNKRFLKSEETSHRFGMSDEEREVKNRLNEKKNNEDTEDGFVSILPLKKRKSTVQQVEKTTSVSVSQIIVEQKQDSRSSCSENVTQTQSFLQDIDVDRFLSQIHGQTNR